MAYPTNLYAEENGDDNAKLIEDEDMRNYVIEKAIEAFPEYEEQIKGEVEINLSKTRSVDGDEIVVQETRSLSENETVTYTEYG